MKRLVSSIGPLFLAFLLGLAPPVQADSKLGVVLMHGKLGTSLPRSPVGRLASELKAADILVVAPDMPWSRDRRFDRDHASAMAEITQAIEQLKSDGATKIVVGGHSLGANAAIGYGARVGGVAGVLAMAPGHVPDMEAFQQGMDFDYKRAREMISAGKGEEKAEFKDINQGKKSTFETTAAIYHSWYDPEGPANMPANAKNLKPGIAFLWIVGEDDGITKRGEAYVYAGAPKHPKSAYLVVGGGHRDTPTEGAQKIIDWLKGL